jgi:hypothetical protein
VTPDEARALVESIRAGLEDIAPKIRQAYEDRAWIALGYDSWALMCQQEFGGALQLPSGKRREVIKELAGAGMSSRAIAGAVGDSKSNVHRQVSQGGTPEAKVIGLDGKRYTPPAPKPKPIVDPAPPKPRDLQAVAQHRMSEALFAVRVLGETPPLYLRDCWLSTRQNLRSELRAALHLLDETKREGE